MSEGKSAGFFPSPSRPYAVSQDHGMGLGGGGTGSPPSAISTPVLLASQAADLSFGCFDRGACTIVGKTATAANKTNVTRVPQTLSFDIFISLKELTRTGAADRSTLLDPAPRVEGKWDTTRFAGVLVGIPTKTQVLATYQSV